MHSIESIELQKTVYILVSTTSRNTKLTKFNQYAKAPSEKIGLWGLVNNVVKLHPKYSTVPILIYQNQSCDFLQIRKN